MNAVSSLSDQAQPSEPIGAYQQHPGDLPQPQQARQPEGVRVVTKFLIQNAAAGAVIGRAGTNIQYYQNQTGARIQLSRSGEHFPGTNDRVIVLAGTGRQVGSALHLMLDKIQGERPAPAAEAQTPGESTQQDCLRLLVPAALCGGILGRGGTTIRSFSATSKTNITVSSQNRQPPDVPDRIVRITGKLDASGETGLLKAVTLITDKLLESPSYSRVTRSSVGYGRPTAYRAGPATGYSQEYQMRDHPEYISAGYPVQDRVDVTLPIADSRIGAIIGKKGEVINQLKILCDVRIRISKREEFVPGTRNRNVTISGTAEAVGITQALIRQKLRAAPPAS